MKENNSLEKELNTFIKLTNEISEKYHDTVRLGIIFNDGGRMSLQASGLHFCEPQTDYADEYDAFEVSLISDPTEEIKKFASYNPEDGDWYFMIYKNVPKSVILGIIEKHGGIDFKETIGQLANETLDRRSNAQEVR